MSWLKRNLFMLVGGLIALGLLGFGGYLVFSNYQEDDEVSTKLTEQTEALAKVKESDPFPNPQNISSAKNEEAKIQAFLKEAEKFLAPGHSQVKLDTRDFKSLLEETIDKLKRRAESSGVSLPADFGFTFQALRPKVQFTAGSLDPLAAQLADIQALCGIVFDAKAHSILSIRRTPGAADDASSSPEFLTQTIVTNAEVGAVIVPYQISFVGSTTELSESLAGFAKSPHCFIVKSVSVETPPSSGEVAAAPDATAPPPPAFTFRPPPLPGRNSEGAISRYGPGGTGTGPGAGPRMSPALAERYGIGVRPPPVAPVAPMVPAPAATASKGPVVVLEERPLMFTVSVEVVKLLAAK